MTRLVAALCLALAAGPVAAACFADYKAKQDNPLRLHYGVIELPEGACADPAAAEAEIARRIAAENWELLSVMATFDEAGLEERRASAGDYFLRF